MKKKKVWAAAIGAALLFSLVLAFSLTRGTAADVAIVKKGDIKEYVEDIGTVKCKDLKTVCIEGSGLIQSISADVGQQVKKGDILLTMEKMQLEIQLAGEDERIKEIEANFMGSGIKNYTGDVEKAKIALNKARDAYELALYDYNNAKILLDAEAISRQEFRQKEAELKDAGAMLNDAEVDLQQIEINTPESAGAAYQAQLEQAALSRESISHSLKKQEVVSPMDGVVLEKKVEVNTVGAPGTVAFVIGDVGSIEVEAYILAEDAVNVNLGDEVEIAERSENKQVIEGRVVKIAPGAVEVTSSLGVNQKKVSVTVDPEDSPARLKHGYEVDVRVITEKKSDVITVPLSSVFEYKDKDCVFAVIGGKAVLRTVQKGIQDESFVEIVDGLNEGETVLYEPDISVKEGMRIKPVITAR